MSVLCNFEVTRKCFYSKRTPCLRVCIKEINEISFRQAPQRARNNDNSNSAKSSDQSATPQNHSKDNKEIIALDSDNEDNAEKRILMTNQLIGTH